MRGLRGREAGAAEQGGGREGWRREGGRRGWREGLAGGVTGGGGFRRFPPRPCEDTDLGTDVGDALWRSVAGRSAAPLAKGMADQRPLTRSGRGRGSAGAERARLHNLPGLTWFS
jgi:hypothetical protein